MSDRACGSCACGAVRFAAELPPRFVAHCHCDNCRRAHGAGFVTWAGFPEEQVAVVDPEGLLRAWQTPTGATRQFCAQCGTTLTYASPRWAGEIHVAVAGFDDPLGAEPKARVYADRAPGWCPLTDDLPRLGGESGVEPLEDDD